MKEEKELEESLTQNTSDPLINRLNKVVVISVKFLAILMVVVIVWSLGDVLFHLYRQINSTIIGALSIENLFITLGNFLAVLIAIEVFLNIIFYLKKAAIHVPLVLGTALTAISRKVIVFDFNVLSPAYIFATASVILAVGIAYWLTTKKS